MLYKEFKVVTVSKNTNSFGLRGFIAVAKDGDAFEAAANYLNVPKKGSTLQIAHVNDRDGNPTEKCDYGAGYYEIPRQLDKCPADVVKAIWEKFKTRKE